MTALAAGWPKRTSCVVTRAAASLDDWDSTRSLADAVPLKKSKEAPAYRGGSWGSPSLWGFLYAQGTEGRVWSISDPKKAKGLL
jgi:hypothetical protein